MKKLLACFSLFALLLAFASMASAAPLYEENFAHSGGKSLNWTVEPDGFLDLLSRATVSGAGGKQVLGLHTLENEFRSVQTFDFVAGNTYTMAVHAFHTLANLGKPRDITLAFMVEDAIIASFTGGVGYDTLPGYDKGDEVVLNFVADQNYTNVTMAIFLGNTSVTYGFDSITLAATPIPGALFLLAPGLAGMAALRKRMR